MSDLIRKQVYLERRQSVALKRRAEVLGISESELIRRAIDSELQSRSLLAGSDPEALQDIQRFIQTHKAQGDEPYRFNREEIYNERLKRYDVDTN